MSELPRGRVQSSLGGRYAVRLDDGREVEASVRGRLKREGPSTDRVVPGDVVRLAGEEGAWAIESVEARRNVLARAGFRARSGKPIAANLDRLLIMVAARDPEPSPEFIDRMLVISEAAGIPAALVVNKVDLPGGHERALELGLVYEGLGVPVHAVSAVTGEGCELLERGIETRLAAIVGPSGAGKSSLLNRLQPDLEARTGEVGATGRGRHTTVSSRVVRLPTGGRVVDTPGFADAQPWDVSSAELGLHFPEIRSLRDQCRFRECTHLHEPGCAVREALGSGVSRSRYDSYRKLMESLQERERRDY